MPGFRYQAYSVEGKLHKGVLEADSARQARAQLRDQGLTPYRVDVIAANDPAAGPRFRPVALSNTEVTQLTRGLASLLEAGLTVEQAFNALIEQAENERVRQVLAALRGEVLAGNTIAKSLSSFPNAFPELYRTLVAAGEASGQLPRVLSKLSDYLEERQQLRARLTLALVYPVIVMVVALRSEEHTSELQSLAYLVCRLLLEKKNDAITRKTSDHHDVKTRPPRLSDCVVHRVVVPPFPGICLYQFVVSHGRAIPCSSFPADI